jgi:hypothetical protein
MASDLEQPFGAWQKLAALVLAVAAVGLPVNQIGCYGLLLLAAVAIFTGEARASARVWAAALIIVAVAFAGQWLLTPPRIDEGHNVFLPSQTLKRELPAEVYGRLAEEFDAQYPPAKRCSPQADTCWRAQGIPDRAYAFSADGVFHKSPFSRAVTGVDFSDPVWLGLGFTNEIRYNWGEASDLSRAQRDRRFWMGLHRWHLTMPWYEALRLPATYVGGELCWRGELLWEGANEHFSRWPGEGCRTIEPPDAGRRIFGMAIKPDTLAMRLTPSLGVRVQLWTVGALAVAAVVGVVLLLVELRPRRMVLPLTLIGLALALIAIDDGSLPGGVRPFDSGDDGLFYDGYGRQILQHLLAGNVYEALRGGESVFYYGGPGLRYFRALEHIVFGESSLGYLALLLLLPIVVYQVFCRFLPTSWAIALILLFVAVPVGFLFGTTFVQYMKFVGKGYADPAAYILFFCALLPWNKTTSEPSGGGIIAAFCAALLFALAIFMKPIVAPAAAVLLGAAGLAALYRRHWARLAATCIGFLPVFSMALHNWVYGHVFVLFSSNTAHEAIFVMPPSAYVEALRQLLHFDFGGLARIGKQIADWLSGSAEFYATIPLNAAGVVILVYVVLRGRRFDPWLRVIGAAALAQHAVAFFYVGNVARYHFLTWFLTMLVVVIFLHEMGVPWLRQRFPVLTRRISEHPLAQALASGLTRLQKLSA